MKSKKNKSPILMARQMVRENFFDNFSRLHADIQEMCDGVISDPLMKGAGRRWERDFYGEVSNKDISYAIFIVVLSVVPAAVAAYFSNLPQWKTMARFFGAPLQTVIQGFLTSSLIFLGAHLNRVEKNFSVAFKLTLRIMSLYPVLGFLQILDGLSGGAVAGKNEALVWGSSLFILMHGYFVIRAVRKTYPIALQNAVLFFGIIFVVFALLQLNPNQSGSHFGAVPPSPFSGSK